LRDNEGIGVKKITAVLSLGTVVVLVGHRYDEFN